MAGTPTMEGKAEEAGVNAEEGGDIFTESLPASPGISSLTAPARRETDTSGSPPAPTRSTLRSASPPDINLFEMEPVAPAAGARVPSSEASAASDAAAALRKRSSADMSGAEESARTRGSRATDDASASAMESTLDDDDDATGGGKGKRARVSERESERAKEKEKEKEMEMENDTRGPWTWRDDIALAEAASRGWSASRIAERCVFSSARDEDEVSDRWEGLLNGTIPWRAGEGLASGGNQSSLPPISLQLTGSDGVPVTYNTLEDQVSTTAAQCLASIENGDAAAIVCREGPVTRIRDYLTALAALENDVNSSRTARDPIMARQVALPLATVTSFGIAPAFLTGRELVIGRSVPGRPVDVDLTSAPPPPTVQPSYPRDSAIHVSRRQAVVRVRSDGVVELHNIGRAHARCNGVALEPGKRCRLLQANCVEIGGRTLSIDVDTNILDCIRASLVQWKRKARREGTSGQGRRRSKTADANEAPAEKKAKANS